MPLRSRTFLLRLALAALLAMLASVLLPAASALAGARDNFAYLLPGDICSASGHVQLPDDSPAGDHKACAFCHVQAEMPALPTSLASIAALCAPLRWHERRDAALPPRLAAWLSAVPRGPPVPF